MSRTLVAIFSARQTLMDALDHLAEADLVKVGRTAVVAKNSEGETVLIDNTLSPHNAGKAGGAWGAAVGALSISQLVPGLGTAVAIGAGVVVGAVVGRQTGRFVTNLFGKSLHENAVQRLGETLHDGQVALVVEVDNEQAFGRLSEELSKLKVETVERMDDLAPVS